MSNVIAITNQKGGVGKTTTTLNFGAELAKQGYRTLIIDFDSQANLTLSCGIEDFDDLEETIATAIESLFKNEESSTALPIHSVQENLDLVPSNTMLAATNQELIHAMAREWMLHTAIKPIRNHYDYILIDCAPSLGFDLINALVAADEVLVTMTPAKFSIKATAQLMKSIYMAKKTLNNRLEIAGMLFTCVDERTALSEEVIMPVKEAWENDVKVFDTMIPSAVCVVRSQNLGMTISEFAKGSKPAEAYKAFVQEYLKKTAKEV